MSGRIFVPIQERSVWNPAFSLCGAAVWAALATLAGTGRARFGTIELLFLFAPLVIVPLGLALIARLTGAGEHVDPACVFQVPATLAVVVAFWIPPGRTAAILSTLWLLQCALLALRRFLEWRHEEHTAVSPILNLAHFDLLLGAAWLVLSCAGLRPMGFQEPIILLTAVHFHYSGFATALIASTTLREFDSRNLRLPGLATLIWLIVLLPFVLAAGFVFSPALRFVAAISLSACVTALALVSWWMAGNWQSKPARIYLRIAACAALGAFSLAGIYAVSEYFHRDWITVPGMANSHGLLNGLGFVLLMLLAWLMELDQRATVEKVRATQSEFNSHPSTQPSIVFARSAANASTQGLRPAPAPDFIARDFYDR
jgi:hypothetical protein